MRQPGCGHGKFRGRAIPSNSAPSILKSVSESSSKCFELAVPTYPPLSRLHKEGGTVILRIELDESGRVDMADVVSSK